MAGRPALNIPIERIVVVVERLNSVVEAAKVLGCERTYIYKRLKEHDLEIKIQVCKKKATA
jgi:DNA-binding NtrC family response regulator